MKKAFSNKWQAWAGLAVVMIVLTSWESPDMAMPARFFELQPAQDTTQPPKKAKGKREYTQDDLDNAMKGLDQATTDLDKNMKIDFDKMDKEIKKAMEEIKKVDFDKISQEVKASLKKVDWEKTRVEVDKAMREVEMKIKEIDMKKIDAELKRAKENLQKENLAANIDINKIKQQVNEGLAKAKVGIEKARKELSELKAFTDGLEKDGLIDKKKGYKIEIKNKKLIINGKEQSQEVNDKYRKYLDKEDFSISSDGDGVARI